MIRNAIYFFLVILGVAMLSSMLGGFFGLTLAIISPEFVSDLFSKEQSEPIGRCAFTVGMVWGLFIGAAVGGFACGLTVVLKVIRLWFDISKKDPIEANKI
jgi:hypothetical protein